MNIFPTPRKEWLYLRDDVMAIDYSEGLALVYFLKSLGQKHAAYMSCEILDLGAYKMHRRPAKVKSLLKEVGKEPFLFVLWRN